MENNQVKSQEIDLLELMRKIYQKRIRLYKFGGIALIVGITIALITPRKYTAGSVFVPMISSSSSGSGLSGLASLAGINLSGSIESSEIAPNLYPEIVESIPFKMELSAVKVPYEGSFISYRDYNRIKGKSPFTQIKKYTIGLPGLIMRSFFGNKKTDLMIKNESSLIRLTDEDFQFYNQFDQLVTINVDLKEGYIELNVVFDNPVGAAIVAKKAVEILQKKVIEFKIKQANEVLRYAQEQQEIKRRLLYEAQARLAAFKDRNVFISTSTFQTQLMRLESDYNNSNVVFQEVSKQVEEAKLQVSKDTPIFSILKPVVVPNLPSNQRTMTVAIFLFTGLLIGIIEILFRKNLFELFNNITSKTK